MTHGRIPAQMQLPVLHEKTGSEHMDTESLETAKVTLAIDISQGACRNTKSFGVVV